MAVANNSVTSAIQGRHTNDTRPNRTPGATDGFASVGFTSVGFTPVPFMRS
ncbi:hypothetical protein GCM10022232_56520 [Streptomyces plumbiresistens]|uniref:Uncharacterized protein n=1 Tax=Streptomyces plumbiresistens TaxID=511811 RepID=A0ABP7S9I9_9ACTN